jgi:hypothetical protein
MFGGPTVFQFMSHLSEDGRADLERGLQFFHRLMPEANFLGDWTSARLDDTAHLKRLVELRIWRDMNPGAGTPWLEEMKLFMELPVSFGVGVRDARAGKRLLEQARRTFMDDYKMLTWEEMKPYRGVEMTRVKMSESSPLPRLLGSEKEPIYPSLYYGQLEDGWHVSLSEQSLRDLIDRTLDRKEGKGKKELIEANTVFYLAPGAMSKGKDGARLFLEYESQRQSLSNSLLWYPLFRGGLIGPKTTEAERKDLTMRLLGFTPVSPEFAPVAYDAKTDDVVNKRHGSPRHPKLAEGVDPESPLGKLLEGIVSVRADMRFREDGLHATVTLRRK